MRQIHVLYIQQYVHNVYMGDVLVQVYVPVKMDGLALPVIQV